MMPSLPLWHPKAKTWCHHDTNMGIRGSLKPAPPPSEILGLWRTSNWPTSDGDLNFRPRSGAADFDCIPPTVRYVHKACQGDFILLVHLTLSRTKALLRGTESWITIIVFGLSIRENRVCVGFLSVSRPSISETSLSCRPECCSLPCGGSSIILMIVARWHARASTRRLQVVDFRCKIDQNGGVVRTNTLWNRIILKCPILIRWYEVSCYKGVRW